MTVLQPTWIQSETYQAVDGRMADAAVFGGAGATLARPGGVFPGFGGGLNVTFSGLSANIASGGAWVPANSGSGGYRLVNDATVTRTAVAPGSGTRVDSVIARVYDTGVAASSFGDIEIIQGSVVIPAGSNAIKLAEITVGTGGITGVADKRAWVTAVGGITPATSTTRPAAPFDGMAVWEADSLSLAIFSASGGAWRTIPTGTSGAWTSYTPVWSSTGTNPVNGSAGAINGSYLKNGKTVHFRVSLLVSAVGLVVGTGDYAISLPQQAASGTNARWLVNAYWNDVSGNGATESSKHWAGSGIIASGATIVSPVLLMTADPTGTSFKGGVWGAGTPDTPASGDKLTLTGTYECA